MVEFRLRELLVQHGHRGGDGRAGEVVFSHACLLVRRTGKAVGCWSSSGVTYQPEVELIAF